MVPRVTMRVAAGRCFLAVLAVILVCGPAAGCASRTRAVAPSAARGPLVELNAAMAHSPVRRPGSELVSSSSPARQREAGPRMGKNDAPILD
jgi:hypothetical protein